MMTPSRGTRGNGPDGAHGSDRSDKGLVPRDRAGETRERIVDAGVELLHAGPVRDWKRLTIRAAATRAGVNERTVYRHFGDEKGLRDAVLHRNAQEAGIELDGMQLEDITKVATQIFTHIAEYPVEPRPQLSPTLVEANQRQNDAVLGAIVTRSEGWPPERQMLAAAMVDVLWSVATYERLTINWQADLNQVIEGVSWVISLIERDVKDGHGPG